MSGEDSSDSAGRDTDDRFILAQQILGELIGALVRHEGAEFRAERVGYLHQKQELKPGDHAEVDRVIQEGPVRLRQLRQRNRS